jgi:hypothetical protein
LKTLAAIEQAIAPLDAAIRPIAKSGIDLSKPGWLKKLRALKPLPEPWQPALDRAGVREEADTLVAEIIDVYAGGSDGEREAIRALFRKYDSFRLGRDVAALADERGALAQNASSLFDQGSGKGLARRDRVA